METYFETIGSIRITKNGIRKCHELYKIKRIEFKIEEYSNS